MTQPSAMDGREEDVSETVKKESLESMVFKSATETKTIPTPEIVVIRSQKKADALLFGSGFTRLVGVSYVASLSLVQEMFDNGYEEIELIVGTDFSEEFQKELKGKAQDTVIRMASLVSNGKLRLFFPTNKPDHSKLYILSKPGLVRIIIGSANLTESARRANQINTMWVIELTEGHPFVASILKKYEKENRKHCILFMGDLVEELKERIENNKTEGEVIEAWLNRNPEAEEDLEKVGLITSTIEMALDPERNEIPNIVLEPPKSKKTEKEFVKFISPMNPHSSTDGIRFNGLDWANHVREKWGVPLMRLDLEEKVVRANIRGTVEDLTSSPTDPVKVDAGLAHLEDYINTVELGVSPNPLLAKQSMYEALLYILAAPFANERMRATRERHGVISSRGPEILYVTGPSSNGKTAFLKFAMKILTGYNINPLDGQNHFGKDQVRAIRDLQTVFPIAFDDVSARKNLEGVVKPYWDTEWRSDLVFPQLIITSNVESLKEWAKTRMKVIHFDVHFTENKRNKDKLSALLSEENSLFNWFSFLYMESIDSEKLLHDDQLRIARDVMKQLYEFAGRPLPDFFLDMPLEEVHNPGQHDWMRLIQLDKLTLTDKNNEAVIELSQDLEPSEIRRYVGHLPQEIKHRRAGKSLVIENPSALYDWIGQEHWPMQNEVLEDEEPDNAGQTLFSRIFARFGKRGNRD